MTAPLHPRLQHRLTSKQMTARRAGMLIAVVTVVVTIAAGVLMWALDHSEFPNVWLALWWAVQTVTTVGYGDVTPESVIGRSIATIVMLTGIGFLTVVTASITAVFVESARRRFYADTERAEQDRHSEIIERLERIEAHLRER
ncbi:MAG TPA: potassium channel family protein [Gaiellaceae bacterium]|nr:potassium channel family protein [Gaiellaceae bacterium]